MSESCPMIFVNVDSNVSRLSALFTSLVVIVYILSLNVYFLYFLALDFYMRLFAKKELSLIFVSAKFIKGLLRLQDKNVDGGAKRLAGFLGLSFVTLLIAANYLHFELLSYLIALVFLSCSLLDALFDYCLGCKTYHIIKKIYPDFMT